MLANPGTGFPGIERGTQEPLAQYLIPPGTLLNAAPARGLIII